MAKSVALTGNKTTDAVRMALADAGLATTADQDSGVRAAKDNLARLQLRRNELDGQLRDAKAAYSRTRAEHRERAVAAMLDGGELPDPNAAAASVQNARRELEVVKDAITEAEKRVNAAIAAWSRKAVEAVRPLGERLTRDIWGRVAALNSALVAEASFRDELSRAGLAYSSAPSATLSRGFEGSANAFRDRAKDLGIDLS